jgi:hypothetical protein
MFVGTALVLLGAIGTRRIMRRGLTRGPRTPVFALLAAAALVDLRLDVRVLDYWKDPAGSTAR